MIEFKGQQIRAAIFDMDGTMFDTERLRFETLRKASTELFGTPISDEILIGSLGLSAVKAEELAKSQYGQEYPYAAIRKRADELELAHVRTYGVPVKPGLYEVLERLKKNNLLMAVATSSRRAIAEEYLINANVMKYFDITRCGDEVQRGKPNPEIFLSAAHELNCLPEHCLMFEDSENGMLSASGAGGRAILIKDIKEPSPQIKDLAFAAYDSMPEFLADLVEATFNFEAPQLTEAFPQTLNQHTVGIHGFGAMGGGYLSQIFSHWDGYTRPKKIVCVTGNTLLRELLNGLGKYNVHYGDLAFDQTIENIQAIDSADQAAVSTLYAVSEVVGLCLPEGAIKQQAGVIAKGLLHRHEAGNGPLLVLVILNKVRGAAFVRECVRQQLLKLCDAATCDEIMAKTDFAETVVNRIVSKVPDHKILKQLQINLAGFETQAFGKKPDPQELLAPGVLGTLTERELNMAKMAPWFKQGARLSEAWNHMTVGLFDSGPDMQLYVQRGHPLLTRLRQIQTVEDIAQIQLIKNKLLNGTHAIVAWYSALLGYRTIGQGIGDPQVSALADQLITHELKPAMLRENPELAEFIDPFSETFIKRCKVSFKDPCRRVGRDPLRKLQRKERILGSIALAARHGIETPALEMGTALGVLYAIRSGAADDKECQRIRALYERRHAIADVLTYSDPYNGNPYQGLDPEADAGLIERISQCFNDLYATQLGKAADAPSQASVRRTA